MYLEHQRLGRAGPNHIQENYALHHVTRQVYMHMRVWRQCQRESWRCGCAGPATQAIPAAYSRDGPYECICHCHWRRRRPYGGELTDARGVLALESQVGAQKRATRAIHACLSARLPAQLPVHQGFGAIPGNWEPGHIELAASSMSLYRSLSSHDLSKRIYKCMDCMDCVLVFRHAATVMLTYDAS
jgi:hypothetical protein